MLCHTNFGIATIVETARRAKSSRRLDRQTDRHRQTDRRIDNWIDRRIDSSIDRQMARQMDRRMDSWTDRWIDNWIDRQLDRSIAGWIDTYAQSRQSWLRNASHLIYDHIYILCHCPNATVVFISERAKPQPAGLSTDTWEATVVGITAVAPVMQGCPKKQIFNFWCSFATKNDLKSIKWQKCIIVYVLYYQFSSLKESLLNVLMGQLLAYRCKMPFFKVRNFVCLYQ